MGDSDSKVFDSSIPITKSQKSSTCTGIDFFRFRVVTPTTHPLLYIKKTFVCKILITLVYTKLYIIIISCHNSNHSAGTK